jgi:hypothetical protein
VLSYFFLLWHLASGVLLFLAPLAPGLWYSTISSTSRTWSPVFSYEYLLLWHLSVGTHTYFWESVDWIESYKYGT